MYAAYLRKSIMILIIQDPSPDEVYLKKWHDARRFRF